MQNQYVDIEQWTLSNSQTVPLKSSKKLTNLIKNKVSEGSLLQIKEDCLKSPLAAILHLSAFCVYV